MFNEPYFAWSQTRMFVQVQLCIVFYSSVQQGNLTLLF